MAAKNRLIAGMALPALALTAFFTGRVVEERALVEKMRANWRRSVPTPAPAAPVAPPLSHQQLAVDEIYALPFAEFYEALRSAPGDARQKWASELAAMPDGPRRRAAISGFYKLLVQFDPAGAVKAIGEIEDEGSLRLALGAAVNAAPGFALSLMAELSLSLEDRVHGKRDYLSDVVQDWTRIDPPAAARFIDDHPDAFKLFSGTRSSTLEAAVYNWAAIDPDAAKKWIDAKEDWTDKPQIHEAFVEGWYEGDHAAAVSYALAHAEEKAIDGALGAILRNLYYDSKEDAKKFIQSLPESKRQAAFNEAFRTLILSEEADTGDRALSPVAVASWMIEFPPAYWQGVLGRLFRYSPHANADMLPWIERLPPGVREAAAAEYSGPMDKSPAEFIMSVFQVADPVLRDQLLNGMLINGRLGFDDAVAGVQDAPISPEQKRHFMELIAATKARSDEEAARLERESAEADQGSEK